MRIHRGGMRGPRVPISGRAAAGTGRPRGARAAYGRASTGSLPASRLFPRWGSSAKARAIVVPEFMRLIDKAFAGSSGYSARRSYLSVGHSSHRREDGGPGQNLTGPDRSGSIGRTASSVRSGPSLPGEEEEGHDGIGQAPG